MTTTVALLLSVYALFCLLLFVVWQIWRPYKPPENMLSKRKLTVIVAVRNEAANIVNLLKDLENQSISNFEVIIADDDSRDDTAQLIETFQETSFLNLTLLKLEPKAANTSPKKRAISACINQAVGDIIVTTDGDCRLQKDWLKTILGFFEEYQAVFVSAPVFFLEIQNSGFWAKVWNKIQQIEFSSLIVSGAVSMKLGQPNMCSGANIAYLKSAFYEVGGFEGNEHVASGDDEFLLHKMHHRFGKKVQYLKAPSATVYTHSLASFGAFYLQRRRWAGKWTHYQSLSPKLIAIFIFCSNTAFIIGLLCGEPSLLLLKLIPEFIFLTCLSFFTKRLSTFFLVPILQIFYPFYVVLFGLSSLRKKTYVWKNRNLN